MLYSYPSIAGIIAEINLAKSMVSLNISNPGLVHGDVARRPPPGSLSNAPRILRGAFVEYGLSIPPLFVVFQFNPVQLSRSRSLSFNAPGDPICPPCPPVEGETSEERRARESIRASGRSQSLRQWHQKQSELKVIQDGQVVTIQEESISFEIRLDATDKLNEGDAITEQFGIAPQLATLELMMLPKEESVPGLVGSLPTHGNAKPPPPPPPMILFIWGRKKVLPVNINSMSITESEFSTDLNPIRATVSVNLTVIESKNQAYTYSKAMTEAMSVLNLANIADIANVVIPG